MVRPHMNDDMPWRPVRDTAALLCAITAVVAFAAGGITSSVPWLALSVAAFIAAGRIHNPR